MRNATNSVPLKVSHVVEGLTKNLSDNQLFETTGVEKPPVQIHGISSDDTSKMIPDRRFNTGLSPLEM